MYVCIVLTSGSVVKNPLVMWEMQIWSPGEEESLEKKMTTLQYSCLENYMDEEANMAEHACIIVAAPV